MKGCVIYDPATGSRGPRLPWQQQCSAAIHLRVLLYFMLASVNIIVVTYLEPDELAVKHSFTGIFLRVFLSRRS